MDAFFVAAFFIFWLPVVVLIACAALAPTPKWPNPNKPPPPGNAR